MRLFRDFLALGAVCFQGVGIGIGSDPLFAIGAFCMTVFLILHFATLKDNNHD